MQNPMIHSADFWKSYPSWEKMGYPDRREYAFIGRSNVGKSSLINLMVGKKNLAKTSNTPGKTQTLNLFLVDRKWNLVDLPGYGYAKASRKSRTGWLGLLEGYFLNRRNLITTFVLIDASIPPKEIDLKFCDWMGEHQIPFSLVFTKADKGKRHEVEKNIQQFKKLMEEQWAELPPTFQTSIKNPESAKPLLTYIEELNRAVLSGN